MWAICATWPFSAEPVKEAARMLARGESALDAAVLVATRAEDDLSVRFVGSGSYPNAQGVMELDAAAMDGSTLRFGAVMALKGYPNPAQVARDVLLHCPHRILVADGAAQFAKARGFVPRDPLTPEMRRVWEEALKAGEVIFAGHDTVGVAALGGGGLFAVTSTSGLRYKAPGRVGDSPVIGSGFYADSEAGAATATGMGEDIMRGCTCQWAVERMRQGATAQQAAREAVLRTHRMIERAGDTPGNMAVVCVDKNGGFGGAANHDGFAYAAASETFAPALYEVSNILL